MEALVYENSPLAEYLKGMSPRRVMHRFGLVNDDVVGHSGEGEHDPDWPVQETKSEDDPFDSPTSDFAPRGTSKFQERIRNKLPKPLELKSSRQRAVLGKLYDACAVWIKTMLLYQLRSELWLISFLLNRPP
jgi:hypothetical protein